MARRKRLIGTITAALMLTAAPAALAVDDEPPQVPAVYAHQIVHTQSKLALTAGGTGNLYLKTRSQTDEAQLFTRTTVGDLHLYRYQSRKFPGQCIGATVANGQATPRMVPCTSPVTKWRFYDFYAINPSSGIFVIEHPGISAGQSLLSSGTGVVIGSAHWSTSGQVPPANAFWSDKTIVVD